MPSAIDISNQALVLLGASPIVSFDDETTEANVLKIMYETSKAQFLRDYPWRAATKYATLAKSTEKPLDPDWDHIFAWPDDAVRILKIVGSNYPNDPMPKWKSVGNEIYSRTDSISAEYVYDIPEPQMDSLMSGALADRIAMDLSYTITGSNTRESNMAGRYERKIEEARLVDRQEATHVNFRISTLTDPR